MNREKGFTAFIDDDEPAACELLSADLLRHAEFAEVYTFSNYAEATLPLLEKQPDVLFLDVEVPGKSGVEFLDSIRSRVNFTFKVVFYSAFSNYMIDAIRRSAFDFLLKPYKPEELDNVVKRLVEQTAADGNIVRPISMELMPRKMAVQTLNELLLLMPEQILMFTYSSERRSWQMMLTDRTVYTLRKTTSAETLTALTPVLVRVSNTIIINLSYLAAVENATQRCRLCPPYSDIDIVASRRYFSKLKERFEML